MTMAGRRFAGLPAASVVRVAALCLVALAIYSVAWRQAPVIEGDSDQYLEVAQDLSDGRLDALHFRTPGYPLLLTLTGSSRTPTRALFVVSLVLHAVSVWLLAVLLSRAGAGEGWVLALTVLLLLPPYVEPAALVMTENLAQFALVAGFVPLALWFAARRPLLLLAAGVAFGGAALVRPVYQLLAPTLGMALLALPAVFRSARHVRGDAARGAVVILAGWIAIVGGTAVFNYLRFQSFGLTSSAGFHLSTKTMALVERLPDDYATVREILVRERDAQLVRRGGTHTGTQTIWSVRDELGAATGLTQPELSAYLVRMNLELIRRAPIEYLQEVARSLVIYWFPAAGRLASMDIDALRWAWTLLHAAVVLTFLLQFLGVLGALVLVMTVRRRASALRVVPRLELPAIQVMAYGLAATIVIYTMGLSCFLDIGEPRQRRPTDLLIVFMCVLGASAWRRLATQPDAPIHPDTVDGVEPA